jgi:hypothetical protein
LEASIIGEIQAMPSRHDGIDWRLTDIPMTGTMGAASRVAERCAMSAAADQHVRGDDESSDRGILADRFSRKTVPMARGGTIITVVWRRIDALPPS